MNALKSQSSGESGFKQVCSTSFCSFLPGHLFTLDALTASWRSSDTNSNMWELEGPTERSEMLGGPAYAVVLGEILPGSRGQEEDREKRRFSGGAFAV